MITAAFDRGWEWIWEIPLILVIYGTGQPSGEVGAGGGIGGRPQNLYGGQQILIATVSFQEGSSDEAIPCRAFMQVLTQERYFPTSQDSSLKNRISPILKTVFLAPLHATPLTRSGTIRPFESRLPLDGGYLLANAP